MNFVANLRTLASWTIVDQVRTADEFNLEKCMNPGRSNITEITFKHKGETNQKLWIWSGDTRVDFDRNQALKMTVKTIGDSDHLFIEAGGLSTRNPQGWQSPWYAMKQAGKRVFVD